MTACRSAGPNELTTSSVVGAIDGEAAGSTGDFERALQCRARWRLRGEIRSEDDEGKGGLQKSRYHGNFSMLAATTLRAMSRLY